MTDFLRFVISGFPLGCVYALVAAGLVLTHRTAGVFNLAFGAQAFVSAAVFYELRVEHGWPTVPAFGLAVVVVAPLLGLLLDRLLFRHLRTAPVVARLVATLGLLVAIPALVELWFGSGTKFNPPSLSPDPDRVFRLGDYTITADQLTATVVTLLVIAALGVLLHATALGLRMRAVVESPRLVELAGVDADRIGSTAWMLSSFMAGLAGVLLAPLFATVSSANFTILLVAAIAAAAFGRLSSLGLTLAGGVLLGVGQQVLAGYLPLDSVLAQGLRPSLPFLMLLGIVLLSPAFTRRRELQDPLAGVSPPRPRLASTYRNATADRVTRVLQPLAAVAFLALALFAVSGFWLFLLTTAVVLAVVFLSITLVTGLGGQISLCQATFAGLGAFTAGQLATRWDVSVLVGMVVGGAVAAAVAAVLAVPVRRLDGVYVALATLAFALMVENVLFPLDWLGNGDTGVDVPRPVVGSVDFSGDRAFFLLALGVFALAGTATVMVRRGSFGLRLAALRGSELGAAASGVDPARTKVALFALSGAVAGVGGALYASLLGRVSGGDFAFFFSLFWVVLVVTLGARTVEGAAIAGLSLVLMPEALDALSLPAAWTFVLFGLGAVTFARHPEGVVEAQKRATIERLNRLLTRRPRPTPAAGAATGVGR